MASIKKGEHVTGTYMHDPLAVAEAIYPSRFIKYARGHMIIHLQ